MSLCLDVTISNRGRERSKCTVLQASSSLYWLSSSQNKTVFTNTRSHLWFTDVIFVQFVLVIDLSLLHGEQESHRRGNKC